MTTPPRPAIERLLKRIETLEAIIYGDVEDFKRTNQPAIVRVIRSEASQLLRDAKVLRDVGVWSSDKLYGPGAMTTYQGVAWVAQIESRAQQPGTGAAWRLAAKSVDVELRKQIRSVVRDEMRKQERGR
jgi:hypothetical protein